MNTRIMAVALACGGFMAIAGQPPTTWYVDHDSCPEPGSGTEADPFCQIQDCIDAAMDGDECVVTPGTYFENINFLGKSITVQSLEPTNPDIVAATIIDGSGATEDEIEGSVVTFNQGEGIDSTLNGLTLMNGKGFKPSPHASNGGGVYCHTSSPTLRNLVIRGNTADHYGGGMYVFFGSPILANCRFENNTANSGGTPDTDFLSPRRSPR